MVFITILEDRDMIFSSLTAETSKERGSTGFLNMLSATQKGTLYCASKMSLGLGMLLALMERSLHSMVRSSMSLGENLNSSLSETADSTGVWAVMWQA